MDIRELKSNLLDFAPVAIEELKSIITDGRSSAKVKLDAITLLFDRVGLPALRASISQTLIGSPMDLGNLIESKTQLALESEKLNSDINEIEVKLGKANSVAPSSLRGSVSTRR
jgi:hypothetical protein